MKLAALTAIVLALAAPALAAPQSAAPKRQCFSVLGSDNHFAAVDKETINIGVNGNEVWQLKLLGSCGDIDWTLTAGLRSRSGGSFVCDPTDLDVVAPSLIGPQTCPVTAMRKLSKEEIAALPRKQRP